MNVKATTIPNTLLTRIVRGRAALDVLLVVVASAIIAIAAQIAIPIPGTVVPLTMQPLAVLLVGITLGSTRGAAAAALYLLEGFSGMPVFAQGHGGAIWLAGPTAGYLFSYPFAAFVAGWFSERGWGSTTIRSIAGMLVALGIIYLGGWSLIAAVTGANTAWLTGVRPFLIADILKVAVGASLLPQLQRMLAKLLQP
ncbi:MAG TPA: biotin transporter BioY [Thermoanaerobaculia bacterium]|jgi:biotin transport system substrate-specific component|nr:biotin transporter BioY [Thermoanaerobaculia bacterium]